MLPFEKYMSQSGFILEDQCCFYRIFYSEALANTGAFYSLMTVI